MSSIAFRRTTGIRNLLDRIRQEPRPIRFLTSRLLWRSGLSRLFTIQCNGYRVRFYPTAISATCWQYPEGGDDEDFIRRYCRAGDTVVDVGANIGSLSLAAAAVVGTGGRVVAIEPHPTVFKYLCSNVKLNSTLVLEPLNVALGDEPGTLRFSDLASDNYNAIDETGALEVPVSTLDILFKDCSERVRLLKIDVEGYEEFVFRGAGALLARTDCILYESWDRHFARYGSSSRVVAEHLATRGFKLFKWKSGRLEQLGLPYCSTVLENLIACRDEAELRQRLEIHLPHRSAAA